MLDNHDGDGFGIESQQMPVMAGAVAIFVRLKLKRFIQSNSSRED